MSDYNYFSAQSIEAATGAIRQEAKTWYKLSDQMRVVATNSAHLDLDLAAFMVADSLTGAATADALMHAYDTMQRLLSTLLKEATTELEQFGDALNKSADWYERSDANAVVNLDKIWSK